MNPDIHTRLDQYGYLDEARRQFPTGGIDHIDRIALQLYQKNFAYLLDPLVKRHHNGRSLVANGLDGPASYELLVETPRCSCPDYQHAGEHEARFPTSCVGNVTVSWKQQLNGLTQDDIRRAMEEAARNIETAIDEIRFVHVPDQYPNTIVHIDARPLGNSVLAWQTLTQGSCGQRLEGTEDSRRNWSYRLNVTVKTHERFHAMGAGHTNNPLATSNPYIGEQAMSRNGALHELDIVMLERIGYRRRTNDPGDPGDPGDPPANDPKLFLPAGLKAGVYVLKPWTE